MSGPLILDCASSGALSRSKSILIKLYIDVGCNFTVCRVKEIAEISLWLSENEGTQCGLHHTAISFFVLPFRHLHGFCFLSFYATLFYNSYSSLIYPIWCSRLVEYYNFCNDGLQAICSHIKMLSHVQDVLLRSPDMGLPIIMELGL